MATATIRTRQCGEVQYETDSVITFPEGLAGFEKLRKFIILEIPDAKPFRWLFSIEDESVGFLLIDPHVVKAEYVAELPVQPGLHSVYCIVTMHPELEKSTINFKGPIIIDSLSGVGRQLILNSERYPVAYSFLCHDIAGK